MTPKPKITMPLLRFIYRCSRVPTKKKKVHSVYCGMMDESEYLRCLEIIKLKQ